MLKKKHEILQPAYINRKNIVMMGVMKSRFPANVGKLAMNQVSQTALLGSAVGEAGINGRRKGIVSSIAIAAKSLGAPATHCNAAPIEDMIIPIFTMSS
mmetsp:Transcript_25326/g.39227  ORF Transcript_25326/g.39227 Transcript_25326/m.39227 type:complete len:99 (+) Transcript_25326:251-547(+)